MLPPNCHRETLPEVQPSESRSKHRLFPESSPCWLPYGLWTCQPPQLHEPIVKINCSLYMCTHPTGCASLDSPDSSTCEGSKAKLTIFSWSCFSLVLRGEGSGPAQFSPSFPLLFGYHAHFLILTARSFPGESLQWECLQLFSSTKDWAKEPIPFGATSHTASSGMEGDSDLHLSDFCLYVSSFSSQAGQ